MARDLAAAVDPGARRGPGCLLGRTYAFTWALGHLIELSGPEHYVPELSGRWRLALLPVLPERFALRPREGRTEQLAVVRDLLGRAAEVIVATDAGREGELIWGYIRDVCGYAGPVRRLWLSESTPAAVRAAFAALRDPPVALEAAARARAEADWVVGMNATMALSARHGGLWSAGRVQTPTLALLCAREAEVRAFEPQGYFAVLADFEAEGGDRYAGRWFRRVPSGRPPVTDRLESEAEAAAIVSRTSGRPGRLVSVIRRRASEAPPRLFQLTDLQRAANARFGMTAAATLEAAQALYERHRAITYPRTDCRHVSREVFGTFGRRLRALSGAGADLAALGARLATDLPDPGPRVVDDAAVTDHHALLPTAQAVAPDALGPDEARVYELVVRRFLAALLPAAQYDDTDAVTEVERETFRSHSRVLAVPGWREAEPPEAATTRGRRGRGEAASSEAAEADPPAGDLSRLREGQASLCRRARSEARQTRPPARYTEATLLRAMETAGRLVDDEALADAMRERGLGTPATRAQIIETLIRRQYVRRDRRVLVPTPRGEQLVGLAPPELREPATTGEWEARLHAIEAGRGDAAAFLRDVSELARRVVGDVAAQAPAVPVASADALGTCPRCGGPVVETPKAFGCARWRPEHGGCRWVLWKTVAGKAITVPQARELLAKGETSRILKGFRSRAGQPFEARLRLDRETGRVTFLFDAPPGGAASRPAEGPRAGAAGRNAARPPRESGSERAGEAAPAASRARRPRQGGPARGGGGAGG